MSAVSKIGWTRATWNPTLGCSKISPGCKRCYAIHDVHRMAGNPNPKLKAANEGLTVIQGGEANWTGRVRLIPERLEIPLKTRKPTTYFVNSLSDLFHEELSDADIDRVFAVMALCPQHRFQVLTKRAARMRDWHLADLPLSSREEFVAAQAAHTGRVVWDARGSDRHAYFGCGRIGDISNRRPWPHWPLPNVWLGVSAESREYLSRIDHLRQIPAAVRFLSLEPLLEDLGTLNLEGIHWVIVGGESGRGARPMHPDWVRSIQRQCETARVPFFFKQHGEYVSPANANGCIPTSGGARWLLIDGRWAPEGWRVNAEDHGVVMYRVGKKKAGRLLDGRTWDQMPGEKVIHA